MRCTLTVFALVTFVLVVSGGAAHAQWTSVHDRTVNESDLPSRVGSVQPSADYAVALTAILQHIVTAEGRVRYDLLRDSLAADFRRVLKAVEKFDASKPASQQEKLAFWMNGYNVLMLQNIREAPDAKHIIEDGYAEPFFKTRRRIARQEITLDQIEHVILRRREGPSGLVALQVDTLDPRVHVGIHCAAVSCPALRTRAFTAQNVDEELDRAMRDFTRRERHLRMDGKVMVLSSILDWFGEDFDRPEQPAGDFLLAYMPKERTDYTTIRARLEGKTAADIRSDPRVRFEYDWSINYERPTR